MTEAHNPPIVCDAPAMDSVNVVVAHAERAVVSVGDVFFKIDTLAARVDAELAAMRRAPIPTPKRELANLGQRRRRVSRR